MNTNFDPRAWNLFAGAALLSAGCGARVASQDEAETGETADTDPDGPETGPECMDFNDCPVGYGCYDGVCMYYPHHDGWIPYYDCYSDQECDEFQLCMYNYCESVGEPSPACEDLGLEWPAPTIIEVGGEALALTFADVDGDGRDELVVVTQSELRVLEHAGVNPSVSPRDPGSVADMVAGDFDAVPGQDVLLLVPSETLVLHGSNGDGSFAAGVQSVSQLGFVTGLAAGDFDPQPPSDLLAWGGAGAFIDLSGQVSIFNTSQILAAAVHEIGSPEPGFALRQDTTINFYTIDAQLIMSATNLTDPVAIAAFGREFESEYVTLLHHSSWSRVVSRNPYDSIASWPMYGTPEQVFAGDLDGSETDELVFFDGTTASLQYNPLQDGDCWHQLPVPGRGSPTEAVFGDHDGDGDLELAIATDMGDVALFDGG